MGKFSNKRPGKAAVKTPATPAPAVEAVQPESEPALQARNNAALSAGIGDIRDDGSENKDVDVPNTKHTDMDFSNHPNFVGGKRMIQTDALARALNSDCYLLDVTKEWGRNPLGGRPVPIRFAREFPGKRILYDHFDSSPETGTKEKVEQLVAFKMKMANEHGFIYLYQHQWTTLNTDELDRQLAQQKLLLKKLEQKN